MTNNKVMPISRIRVACGLAVTLLGAFIFTACGGQSSSAPQAAQPTIDQAQLDILSQRPLTLPGVPSSSGACPVAYFSTIYPNGSALFGAYGTGPVFGIGGPETVTDWGSYFDVTYYFSPGIKGPILFRARDLTLPLSVVFVGPHVAGQVVGTDVIGGKSVNQYGELAFAPNTGSRWSVVPIRQGAAKGWSHCAGLQIDAPDFSEIVIL